uniref:Secreted protein n=1 Tax=Bursaphelenchus xylophilus TaxID=6326 RepID=A0A1I7SEA0_BURXY
MLIIRINIRFDTSLMTRIFLMLFWRLRIFGPKVVLSRSRKMSKGISTKPKIPWTYTSTVPQPQTPGRQRCLELGPSPEWRVVRWNGGSCRWSCP